VSAHAAGITGIACAGNFVATSSEDGTVKFWDIVEGKEIKSWHAHEGGVRSVAFTADGHILTSGRDHLVRLWDVSGNTIKQFPTLNDIAMQAAPAGGKIIAADWSGLVRVWKPDGTPVGDLDSNPPTIAQRIDALNKRLADLQSIAVKRQNARTRAEAALAAARQQAADGAVALGTRKAEFADEKARLAALQKQAAQAATAIQNARQETARLDTLAGEIAFAFAANPLLQPEAESTLASHALAEQSLSRHESALGQTQYSATIATTECADTTAEIRKCAASNTALAGAVKSASDAVAAAAAAQDKTAAQINGARLSLAKWQAAAAHLPSNPQYASRKTGVN
jgi:hypothetical protein